MLYFKHHYKFRTILYSFRALKLHKAMGARKLGTHGNRWHDGKWFCLASIAQHTVCQHNSLVCSCILWSCISYLYPRHIIVVGHIGSGAVKCPTLTNTTSLAVIVTKQMNRPEPEVPTAGAFHIQSQIPVNSNKLKLLFIITRSRSLVLLS